MQVLLSKHRVDRNVPNYISVVNNFRTVDRCQFIFGGEMGESLLH